MNREKRKPGQVASNTISCFTDGSKFGESSGYGYIIRGANIMQKCYYNPGNLTTVYQAELIAIQEAAFTMLVQEVRGKTITFYVDNQAAIKTLGNYQIRSKVAAESKRMVNKLAEYNEVKITWIPGHSGHMGNEVADRLAKRGTVMKTQGPWCSIPVAEAVVNMEIKTKIKKMWQEKWTGLTKCRQTKMMLPNASNNLWRQLSKHPRKKMNLITQLYTGHNTLKRHLNVMSIEDDGRCNQCEEDDTEETVEHYLTDCPAFARNRHHTLGNIVLNSNELPNLSLDKILKFVSQTCRFDPG